MQACTHRLEASCGFYRLVASLSSSCIKSVKIGLVNKIVKKLDVTIRPVTRLFQQDRYSHDITILLQPCVVNFVTSCYNRSGLELLGQTCNKSGGPTCLLLGRSTCVHNLLTTCWLISCNALMRLVPL